MLARSHGLRLDHNQENPGAAALHHHHLPAKTPARAGKGVAGPAPTTGGKALLNTGKGGRVLGAKDRNGGKRDANEPAALLFPGKPSTSQAGCRTPLQQFKTPAARKTLRPASEMVTPATGVRPKHAPPLMLATPDVSVEMDEQPQEEEEESDREVEYAGPSARDYDEPFIPDYPEPDYKTAGYGAALRGMSLAGYEDPAEWEARDAVERGMLKIELDDQIAKREGLDILSTSPTSQPLFPVPPKRRAPLSAKPVNGASALPASSSARGRVPSAASVSSTGAARKPLGSTSSTSSLRRPLASSSTAASSALGAKRPAPSTSSLRANPTRPGSGLSSTKPSLSSASTLRKPLSTASSASSSTLSRPRPRPTPLSLSRPTSSASLRSTTNASAAAAAARGAAKKEQQDQERELGIFGVVDDEGESALLDFGEHGGMEEGFKLDLDL
ncbi:hypothetical protein JCM10213_003889 [Rhodosporidiobolus nylandii]